MQQLRYVNELETIGDIVDRNKAWLGKRCRALLQVDGRTIATQNVGRLALNAKQKVTFRYDKRLKRKMRREIRAEEGEAND